MDMNCSACMDKMMHMMTKMVCCYKSRGPARSIESTSLLLLNCSINLVEDCVCDGTL